MEIIKRKDKDKEVFRLWYECLTRTEIYWEAYHIYTRMHIARMSGTELDGTKFDMVGEIKKLTPRTISDDKEKDSFVIQVFFFISDHHAFLAAQDIGFDEAWITLFKKYEVHRLDTVTQTNDVIKHDIEDLFFSSNGRLMIREHRGVERDILAGPSISGSELCDFIDSLPLFSSQSMRVNLSIYPFGKTKKELLNEIWDKIAPFKSDTNRRTKHREEMTKWLTSYGPVHLDEIKRYLGVFDLMRSRKGIKYKDIINGNIPDIRDEFIDEALKRYTSTPSRPINEKDKDILDMLGRDHANAKKMIANALAGYFPKYPQKKTPTT